MLAVGYLPPIDTLVTGIDRAPVVLKTEVSDLCTPAYFNFQRCHDYNSVILVFCSFLIKLTCKDKSYICVVGCNSQIDTGRFTAPGFLILV